MLKAFLILLVCAVLACVAVFYRTQCYTGNHPPTSDAVPLVVIPLHRGPFTVYNYMPKGRPEAIILFGSGDGGWLGWENIVGKALCSAGYQVIGIDSAAYAQTDYDLATLQTDYDTIAQTFRRPYWFNSPPVLVGGWSMGAAQAVAVAGGPRPPRGLDGLVVASLVPRGRYGLRLPDKMDIPPTGSGTFSMDQFALTMSRVRVVQLHGTEDIIDSRSWLKYLQVPHLDCDVPNSGHPFNGADDDFLRHLADSVRWILNEPPSGQLHASNS